MTVRGFTYILGHVELLKRINKKKLSWAGPSEKTYKSLTLENIDIIDNIFDIRNHIK